MDQLGRRRVLLERCRQWYNEDPSRVDRLQTVIGRGRVSLRLIEFFLGRLKNSSAVYVDSRNTERTSGQMYEDYQRHLKAFGKGSFDLFCRHEKMSFELAGRKVKTNASQLEFFRWCISSGVLDVIESNLHRIVSDKQKAGRSGSRQ